MKKSLIIPLVSLGVVATCTAAIVFNIQKPQITQLKAGTRDAQIVIDSSWVKNENDGSFDLKGETQSGFPFESDGYPFIYGPEYNVKKTIEEKTYIFVANGTNNGDCYFSLGDFYVQDYYSFVNVVIDGEFTSSHGTDYRYTFDLSNRGFEGKSDVVVYDELFIGISISSFNLKDNYSSVKLEKVTINYTCLS